MDGIIAIAQWTAVVGIAIGLILTWRRNGKDAAERNGAFKNEVKNIGEKLEGMEEGIKDIKESVNKQQVHCATISTQLMERVSHLERSRLRRKSGSQ